MGLAFTKLEPDKQTALDGWLAELSGESPRELKALDDDLPFHGVAEATAARELKFVLNELIVTLIRKNVLSEAEKTAMLKKLMGVGGASAGERLLKGRRDFGLVFAGFGDGGGFVHRQELMVAHYLATVDDDGFDVGGFQCIG
jgi:hypothetical protein